MKTNKPSLEWDTVKQTEFWAEFLNEVAVSQRNAEKEAARTSEIADIYRAQGKAAAYGALLEGSFIEKMFARLSKQAAK